MISLNAKMKNKLTWDDTFKEMVKEKEDWSDFDVDLDKGIE